MKKELIELYKELLFTVPKTTPSLKTYAVIDSLRCNAMELKKLLLISNLNYVDLWHPKIEENAEVIPLYLVELEKESEVLTYLLYKYEEKLATFFISPYEIKIFQRYYARLTYPLIEKEEGEHLKGVFGFYDPTILPNYLQTLYTQEKVDEFFAGIVYALAPSHEDETVLYLACRDQEGKVDDVNLMLNNFLGVDEPTLDFISISLPTIAKLNDYVDDRKLDFMQVKMFDDMNKVRFVKELLKEYASEGIEISLEEEEIMKRAYNLMNEAKKLFLLTEAALYRYVLLGLALSEPIDKYQFYYDIKKASNELERINIMDVTLESMRTGKGK